MIELDLRSLIKRLNPYCSQALHTAAGACISRGHYEVTPEHHLAQLLQDPGSDIPLILSRFDIEQRRLRQAVEQELDGLRSGNPGKPVFSPLLIEWFQDAWLLGSVEYGLSELRSGLLLMALVLRSSRYATGPQARVLGGIPRDVLRAEFLDLIEPSIERTVRAEGAPAAAGGDGGDGYAVDAQGTALGRFTINFSAQAREGRIDPVFGRDLEIRQMIDILARRRKNNPIVVGEPGVGKTAVVEGLALRIAEGDVPTVLHDVELLSLDLGLLQAGAGVRGEFENRLKSVIEEVKASPKPIILFIDEAHTMIGAGGAQGGGDAANLLKPALARGELRTIAATTWKEYKKYFEKDAALARRFERVHIPEPDPEAAAVMLRGLADRYAQTHQVHIQDDAVVAAVELSHRYLTGRRLPDKAVGLLDTCAARVRIGQSTVPSRLEGLRRRVQQLTRERTANQRDLLSQVPDTADRAPEIDAELERLAAEAEALERRWEQEREDVARVVALRRALAGEAAGEAESDAPADASADAEPTDEEAIRAELEATFARLSALQGEQPLVYPDVSPETVAQVVSDWTGIPVGRMVRDEAQAVLRFEEDLRRRIKGQDHALRVIGERIRQARAGLQDPDQPQGVFLLVGPSGVGKTETALGLADLLYGGERSVVTINMSEFQEKHTVSRLIGSPPGYVGYGEGGVLTEAVRQRPYSVVLLDECEKAHRDVMDVFYQAFDKGVLSDGEGREINLRNTMVILTSNLATEPLTQLLESGLPEDHEEVVSAIRPILSRHFKPALLARMTVVPYFPLPPETLRLITDLKLRKVARRLADSHGIELLWEEAVADTIAARCTEVETGARNVDHIIRGTLMPRLSSEILARIGEAALPPTLRVTLGDDGRFHLENA
jgi:type VI secretion system protein VasG